jgi:predicted N-formylglutamate amidohydrolase
MLTRLLVLLHMRKSAWAAEPPTIAATKQASSLIFLLSSRRKSPIRSVMARHIRRGNLSVNMGGTDRIGMSSGKAAEHVTMLHIVAARLKQDRPLMDISTPIQSRAAEEGFQPVEEIRGAAEAGVVILCDHASNALPPAYGNLGLPASDFERHIAYDIGAAWLARKLADLLNAPAALSTFSRLLIDPNRGADDPTLVMRLSDGAIVPSNAGVDEGEIARRRDLYWRPYRETCARLIETMSATGRQPVVLSIHSFTPAWRGNPRPWKVGVLWDMDPRVPEPLLSALARESDLQPADELVGDNEPYDGALAGDTIDDVATSRGLANALIEVRQDLIVTREAAETWAERLARIMAPILDLPHMHERMDFGSRAFGKTHCSKRTAGMKPRTA